MSNVVSHDQNSYKELSATKSWHSTAVDIMPYKDLCPHQTLAIAQSPSLAASSSMKEPLRQHLFSIVVIFHPVPLFMLEMLIRVQKKTIMWMVCLKGYLLNSCLTVKDMNTAYI